MIFSILASNLAACTGAPIRPPVATSAPNGPLVSGPVAAVSGGVVYPDTGIPQPQPQNFNPGSADAAEQAAIARVAPGAKPRQEIGEYVNALPALKGDPSRARANLLFIPAAKYEQLFPQLLIYVLRFPQWPVAVAPPAGLAANNLLVFTRDQALQVLSNSLQLQDFLRERAQPQVSVAGAADVVKAWLSLSAELEQDGMFQFNAPSVDHSGSDAGSGGFEASGHIDVVPERGDLGAIYGKIVLDAKGKLQSAIAQPNLKSGMRPICQATKLLDSDPIVRKMAERDLLVMGRSAREYLLLQRGKASSALRARIDQIWQQILQEGR